MDGNSKNDRFLKIQSFQNCQNCQNSWKLLKMIENHEKSQKMMKNNGKSMILDQKVEKLIEIRWK